MNERRKTKDERRDHLLGLYAYHRDHPSVARALGFSLSELEAELDALKLRRKAARLVRGIDQDLPAARAVAPARSGPPLRRRPAPRLAVQPQPAPLPPPAPRAPAPPLPVPRGEGREQQARALKKLLSEVGPRRELLAARLGTKDHPLPAAVLLAHFRAAGLERELGQRERDLVRALYLRHRGATKAVANELGLERAELLELVEERGLGREVEALREQKRQEARQEIWPRARVHAVLHRREYLADLGILEELEGDVRTRTRIAWDKLVARGLSGHRAVQALSRELSLPPEDARRLARRLGLR